MIRPLRRRHRWIVPALLLLLAMAAAVVRVRPAPSARVDALPPSIVAAEASSNSR